MRKRIAIGVMGLLLVGGGTTAALGAPQKSGDNPPNTYGLCTAAANGNKNGWGTLNLSVPPPFRPLARQGELLETTHNANDARLDILLFCQNAGITPGGQGHGAPLPS